MNIREFFGLAAAPEGAEVGIEIEMEGRRLQFGGLRGKWKATQDGSLRGESVEWVLPQPIGRNSVSDRLSHLMKMARQNDAVFDPSDRCGVHVHVNVQDVAYDDLFKIVTTYLILEQMLVHWCGEDREGNLFCLRASDAEFLIQQIAVVRENRMPFGAILTDELRYSAMNLTSLQKYGSLEFRAMRTPKDLMQIETWVKTLLAIKDWSLAQPDTISIIEGMSGMGWIEFARRVLGDELLVEFRNPDMERQLVEGMRLAQIIAYAEPAEEQVLADDEFDVIVGDAAPDGVPQRQALEEYINHLGLRARPR